MLRIVQCKNCGRSDNLCTPYAVEVKVLIGSEYCERCRKTEYNESRFSFCNSSCLLEWTLKLKYCEEGHHPWTINVFNYYTKKDIEKIKKDKKDKADYFAECRTCGKMKSVTKKEALEIYDKWMRKEDG